MELLRADFKIVDNERVFTSDEIEMIDASVNGFKLPENSNRLMLPIMKKVGVKSWPRAIAMLCKLNVVQALCAMLAVTMMLGSVSSVESYRLGGQQLRYRIRDLKV